MKDIKYRMGRYSRAVKMAINLFSFKVASDSNNILFGENKVLQKKCKFYKDLHQPYKGDKEENSSDMDEEGDQEDFFSK